MKKIVTHARNDNGRLVVLTKYRLFGFTFFEIEIDDSLMHQGFAKPA